MKALLYAREQLYRLGLIKAIHLPGPTISVGNISVGGTGKSPLVQLLTEWSLSNKQTPLILSRGYGRKDNSLVFLEAGEIPSAVASVGDESAMLKGLYPECALLVHKNRAYFARDKKFPLYIMDDAFQHWRAFRHIDIVTLDITQNLNDKLLPFGRLREPLQALARADIVVLTRVDEVSAQELSLRLQAVQDLLTKLKPLAFSLWPWRPARQEQAWPAKIFLTTHHALGGVRASSGEIMDSIRGKKVILFSGIARPESFRLGIERAGAEVVEEVSFADHHVYTEDDKAKLAALWLKHKKPLLLTTEKDFYRASEFLSSLENLHYWRVGLDFIHAGKSEFFTELTRRIEWAR